MEKLAGNSPSLLPITLNVKCFILMLTGLLWIEVSFGALISKVLESEINKFSGKMP
jgi:hypothetical protein